MLRLRTRLSWPDAMLQVAPGVDVGRVAGADAGQSAETPPGLSNDPSPDLDSRTADPRQGPSALFGGNRNA